MKSKEKPKYNTLQNVGWMIKIAWNNRKRVMLFCVLTALFEVLLNLTQLYIAPEVLARVEEKAPLWELLLTIGVFTVALFLTNGLKEYVKQNTLFARVDVRSVIIGKLAQKCNMTSYPNTLDANFIKLREKAHLSCEGNGQATEHIWQTLTMLLKNIGGLLVYLTILSRIDTALVKLLCGLLDPTEGKVLLNGKDIREFNRRSYYDLFSAVFQEFSVLDVTVAEEIAQTTENIDYDRISDCIDKAGLTDMIAKLPKGLQTHVGREVHLDGVLFSGGQTQRLMLARALYKDGPILLLDEPTAAHEVQ